MVDEDTVALEQAIWSLRLERQCAFIFAATQPAYIFPNLHPAESLYRPVLPVNHTGQVLSCTVEKAQLV